LILVTGASGLLGQHILALLAQQNTPVVALYNSTKPNATFSNVTWKSRNLLDVVATLAIMQGITKVYHCAAIVSFEAKDKGRMIANNITITENVVNAALELGIEKLIHVSSIAALGRTADLNYSKLISEETHWQDSKHNSDYAVSKYLSEMEVWRGMAEGLNAAIINPGIILGEGDWNKGSSNLLQVVYDEFPWYTQGVNAWVDVQDVAKAAVLLMDSKLTEQRYIISAGNFSYKDVFTIMANALNKKPPHKKASPFMTELVWRAAAIKNLWTQKAATITKATARTAQNQSYYDSNKFLVQFPNFTYTPLSDTIHRMAQTFLKQKTLNPPL
jgi:dihydroflavonol-4-reductase